MNNKNPFLITTPWVNPGLLRWKIKIQLYKTDEFNNHILESEKEYFCQYNSFQEIDYGSSRGSRDVSASLEVIVFEDAIPEGFVDEARVILLGMENFPNRKIDYKVDSVFRVHDDNGNFHHAVIRGH